MMRSQTSEASFPDHSETRLRVRYAETDQMGVVYYANYLVWMEIGRTDFCIHAGFRYRDLEQIEGIAIAVAEVDCRYHAPARYDDEIRVLTRLEKVHRRTLRFGYDILNAATGSLLAEGHSTHISLCLADRRPRSLPDDYLAILKNREAPRALDTEIDDPRLQSS